MTTFFPKICETTLKKKIWRPKAQLWPSNSITKWTNVSLTRMVSKVQEVWPSTWTTIWTFHTSLTSTWATTPLRKSGLFSIQAVLTPGYLTRRCTHTTSTSRTMRSCPPPLSRPLRKPSFPSVPAPSLGTSTSTISVSADANSANRRPKSWLKTKNSVMWRKKTASSVKTSMLSLALRTPTSLRRGSPPFSTIWYSKSCYKITSSPFI